LDFFDDVMDKYEYIIDLGKKLPKIDPLYKTDTYLLRGCQSKVWLHLYEKEGVLFVEASSDAFIVKGLIYMLVEIYSNTDPKEVVQTQVKELEKLGFVEILSQGRQNGLHAMVDKIYAFAKDLQDAK